jgi:LuxR family maltose regulon positive regulatory protein
MALELAEQMPGTDRFVVCQLFLARLRLAQGDATAATALLAQAGQAAQAQQFMLRLPEIAAAQVLTLIHQGNLASAAHLAATHRLPASQARVYLAQGDAPAALAVLDPLRRQMESAGWEDERLKVVVLQALALHAGGREKDALQLLAGALATGEPEGFRRIFVGEGPAIAPLLSAAAAQGILPDYAGKLLEAIEPVAQKRGEETSVSSQHSLAEPLTQRELEVLRLVAQGLSNQEIGERLFLALDTVKGHNRRIFEKLQVQRRTEAVAKARALHLLLPDL